MTPENVFYGNSRVSWVFQRPVMLKRAARMVKAHWNKGIDWEAVERWYDKHIDNYAFLDVGSSKPNYIEERDYLLNDAMTLVEQQLDVTPENGYE